MTNVGKITGTLKNSATSAEVEIGGAKWSLSRHYSSFKFHCDVGDEVSVLWSCTARGKLTVSDLRNGKQFLVWTDSFDYLDKDGVRSSAFKFPRCNELDEEVKFEAEVEIVKMRIVDLYLPPNKSIQSLEDASCLEVGGMKLWVSKKVLSFHSPFFKALFSSDFKEKAADSYALKDVEIYVFEIFLCILYNMDIAVDDGMIGKLAFNINSFTLMTA
uniref:BTB domain-containing protein n=1 Tax=Steinernema glaseri TaxID=37863 RepID=A0A1I8AQW2_9BILA